MTGSTSVHDSVDYTNDSAGFHDIAGLNDSASLNDSAGLNDSAFLNDSAGLNDSVDTIVADPPLMTKVNYSKSMEMFGIFTGKVNITLNMQIKHWEEIPQPTFTYLKNVVFSTCDSVINEYRSMDSELLGAEFV